MSSEHNAVIQLRPKVTSLEKKKVHANSPMHCFILLYVMSLESSQNYLSVSRKLHDANVLGQKQHTARY